MLINDGITAFECDGLYVSFMLFKISKSELINEFPIVTIFLYLIMFI